MPSAKRFAPEIVVDRNYLVTLKALEYEAYRWGLAAMGARPSYNNPIGRLLAKDLQHQALDRYCAAIEKLIPQKEPNEPA
jgi:hypothetical protein